jgi:lipoprotein-anchoring transpeptidase ErfK/SrfK
MGPDATAVSSMTFALRQRNRRVLRAFAVVGTAGVVVLSTAGSASAAKASKTATTKAASASKSSSSKSSSSKTAPTTAPKPIIAGKGIKGFGQLTESDWPHPEQIIIVRSKGKTLPVYKTPASTDASLLFNDGQIVFGKVALLALDRRDGFWRVAMPVRPNGTTGWVREEDVTFEVTDKRIIIELSTNTLRYVKTAGSEMETLIETRVALGTGGTPTPEGLFFVKEVVPQRNPAGAYGPVALGLSAYSEVLQTFGGGNGVVALHGTNNPKAIGSDVSHGCVRLPNAVILQLSKEVPLGTPVEIVNRLKDLPTNRTRINLSESSSGSDSSDDPIVRGEAQAAAQPTTTVASLDSAATTTAAVTSTTAPSAGSDGAALPSPSA